MTRKTLVIFLVLIMLPLIQAPSLDIRSEASDLGTIEPGSTKQVDLYVRGGSVNQPFEVKPSFQGPFHDTVFGNSNGNVVQPEEVSEQSIENWVSFEQESYAINPSQTKTFTLSDGSRFIGNRKITMELQVPNDAEPGYHAGKITLDAVTSDSGSGFGSSVWTLPTTSFYFRVPGNAERSLSLEDTRAIRIGENKVQIIAMIENEGTVTTELEGGTVNILDSNKRKVGEVKLDSATLKPSGSDKFQEVSMVWSSDDLDEGGVYELDGTGDYITGRFYVGDQISFTDAIRERVQVEDPNQTGQDGQDGGGLPTWLVVMALVLLGVIMYSFDIDPLWIVLIVGLLAISAFVLMTGLPVYIIGITLILGVGMVYYGMI